MTSSTRGKLGLAILSTVLCACGHPPSVAPPSPPPPAAPPAQAVATPPAANTRFSSIDAYKGDVARHIMRYNAEQAFSGPLPPILPAIVVVNITVDRHGNLIKVVVQRSRSEGASAVALASVTRSKPLPKPMNLLRDSDTSLTFSETFLFGDRYHFQLRSLIP